MPHSVPLPPSEPLPLRACAVKSYVRDGQEEEEEYIPASSQLTDSEEGRQHVSEVRLAEGPRLRRQEGTRDEEDADYEEASQLTASQSSMTTSDYEQEIREAADAVHYETDDPFSSSQSSSESQTTAVYSGEQELGPDLDEEPEFAPSQGSSHTSESSADHWGSQGSSTSHTFVDKSD